LALTISFPFDNPANYVFDANKIELSVSNAILKLIDEIGKEFNEDFNDDTGHNYDADLIEFTGSIIQQKPGLPQGTSCYAFYTDSIDLTDGGGILIGNPYGGASVAGGWLNLLGGTQKYVTYNANGNADSALTGTIDFDYKPGYSGAPPTIYTLIHQGLLVTSSRLELSHEDSGQLRLQIVNAGGSVICNGLYAWSPVSETIYRIRINYDLASGVYSVYINYSRVIYVFSSAETRTKPSELRLGSNYNGVWPINAEFDNLTVWPIVQNDQSQTTYSDSLIYFESTDQIPNLIYTGTGNIQEYTGLTVIGAVNDPRYIINGEYWTGSTWATSDGSCAQATSLADMNSHLSSLTPSNITTIVIVFRTSSIKGEIGDLTLEYTGQINPTDNPTIKPAATFGSDLIYSFVAALTAAGLDDVRFTVEVDGVEKWWTGSAWAISSGYSETNDADTINNNIQILLSTGAVIRPVAYLHSEDGSTSPELDTITIEYDFYEQPDPDPSICIVYGYLRNGSNEPIVEATIKAIPRPAGGITSSNLWITQNIVQAQTNNEGYWELNLIQSAQYEEEVVYDFLLERDYLPAVVRKGLTIPAQESAEFGDLT